MTKFGDQPGLGQQFERPVLGEVDDHGIARLAGADEGHDTVAAGIGVLHHARVAIDGEGRGGGRVSRIHVPSMPIGCDSPRVYDALVPTHRGVASWK